jgi:DNA-directed RNA polymerase subunit RPC12/RpoP
MPQETVGYVELEWTCVHCGTKNDGTRQTCSGCGAPMSDSQKFDLPSQQKLITDKDILSKAEAGPDIHCPYCGTRNPAGSTKCSHCGGDLTGAAVRTSGEVMGAFQSAPQPDIKCRYCGTMNPADAKKCKTCGSALVSPVAAAPAVKALASGGIGLIPIVVIGLLVVACISFFVLSARTSDAVGIVRSLTWQRSISILEQRPVTHENWRDKVPAGAKLGTCQQQVRRTQDQPAPNAQKVCGTPYTVNQGNGAGKVVEDCRYNIMDDYCEYTSAEWLRVDAVVAQGTDSNPHWPTPNLTAAQRTGNKDESYQVTFSAGDKTYTYTAHDATEFARFTPGSKWTLKVNGLGNVTSVSPAQ